MSRAKIERARIFVGCEGESESGYSVCLANLARDKDLPVTVDAHVMKKGAPLSRIRWAEAKIRQQNRTAAIMRTSSPFSMPISEISIPNGRVRR